jgi:type II secretory pathway component PulJ
MRGATLIEVVVAGFLLALFLLFSIQPLLTSNRATELNLRRQKRDSLAAQLLERAMLCSEQALRTESGTGYPSEMPDKDQRALTWQVEVKESESDGLLEVAVTVQDPTTGDSTMFQSTRLRTRERVYE